MAIVRPSSAGELLHLAGPLLARDEARHNLLFGICDTAIRQPHVYPELLAWVAMRGTEPAAAALRTPPFNLVLADPLDDDALGELLDAVAADQPELPGIVGNVPFVEAAARRLGEATGRTARVTLSQAAHALTAVEDVPMAPGAPRPAGAADRPLLLAWLLAFARESLPPGHGGGSEMERAVGGRLEGRGSGLWLWEDAGEPVSVAGYAGKTPTGIRVGPVYTPPERRGRGYATSLVAELSRWLLAGGNATCFLYTDLANPTSNAIYARIGYRRVCDSLEYGFAEP
jgi:predicted GNAT family acetyltransferase